MYILDSSPDPFPDFQCCMMRSVQAGNEPVGKAKCIRMYVAICRDGGGR